MGYGVRTISRKIWEDLLPEDRVDEHSLPTHKRKALVFLITPTLLALLSLGMVLSRAEVGNIPQLDVATCD